MNYTARESSFKILRYLEENGDHMEANNAHEYETTEPVDRTNTPITIQSVIDTFNSLVIDRINDLPKISSDYFYVYSGLPEYNKDQAVHRELLDMLGPSVSDGDYGIMTAQRRLTVNDFLDEDGNIDYSDLANTIRNKTRDLSRVHIFKINTYKSDRYLFDTKTVLGMSKEPNENDSQFFDDLINSEISSSTFNKFCKDYFRYIAEGAEFPERRITKRREFSYNYHVPILQPSRSELYDYYMVYTRPGLPEDIPNYIGKPSIRLRGFFATSIGIAKFKLPKASMPIQSVTFRIKRERHYHPLNLTLTLLRNNVIISDFYNEYHGDGTEPDYYITFYTTGIPKASKNLIEDLELAVTFNTTGDRYDGTVIELIIENILYAGVDTVDGTSNLIDPDKDKINLEMTGTRHLPSEQLFGYEIAPSENYARSYGIVSVASYTVSGMYRKPKFIYFTAENSGYQRSPIDGLRVKRDGQIIGYSKDARVNEVNGRLAINRYNSVYDTRYDWRYDPVFVHDVSEIDIRNGDVIEFFLLNSYFPATVFGGSYATQMRYYTYDIELNSIIRHNVRIVVKGIHYSDQLISQ